MGVAVILADLIHSRFLLLISRQQNTEEIPVIFGKINRRFLKPFFREEEKLHGALHQRHGKLFGLLQNAEKMHLIGKRNQSDMLFPGENGHCPLGYGVYGNWILF